MKGLRRPPFKKISLAIVQISLIAGTISLGIQASCKKGIGSCKAKSQLTRDLVQDSALDLLSPGSNTKIESRVFTGFELPAGEFWSPSLHDGHLSRYSGLSPPPRS